VVGKSLILESWDKIRTTLQTASSDAEVRHIGYIEAEVKEEFWRNFSESKIRLAE
jgi:hypothetical protein